MTFYLLEDAFFAKIHHQRGRRSIGCPTLGLTNLIVLPSFSICNAKTCIRLFWDMTVLPV